MASKVKPTDVTGRAREEALAANAEVLAQRAGEMSMATAAAKAQLDQAIDATKPDRQVVIVDEAVKVGEQVDTIEIRRCYLTSNNRSGGHIVARFFVCKDFLILVTYHYVGDVRSG